jgi:hypothetical protein
MVKLDESLASQITSHQDRMSLVNNSVERYYDFSFMGGEPDFKSERQRLVRHRQSPTIR